MGVSRSSCTPEAQVAFDAEPEEERKEALLRTAKAGAKGWKKPSRAVPKPLMTRLADEVGNGWVMIFRAEDAIDLLPNRCLSHIYLIYKGTI